MAEVAGSLPTGLFLFFIFRLGLRLGAFGGPSRGRGWKYDFAKSFVGPAHGLGSKRSREAAGTQVASPGRP